MIIFTEAPKTEKGKKLSKKFAVPDSIQQQLRTKEGRAKLRKNCFLLPSEQKFPICNPNTGKLDCRLIKAAISRAAGFNRTGKKYQDVLAKAEALYKKHCAAKESFSLDLQAITESLAIEYYAGGYDRICEFDQYVDIMVGEYTPVLERAILTEANDVDVRKFSASMKQWLANRSKIPASYFLDPKNKKYPVKGPDGKYNCKLILHARIRAKQHGAHDIAAKADALWNKICKKK